MLDTPSSPNPPSHVSCKNGQKGFIVSIFRIAALIHNGSLCPILQNVAIENRFNLQVISAFCLVTSNVYVIQTSFLLDKNVLCSTEQ